MLYDTTKIKKDFYGNRIVLFAPLYLSNYCINHCVYCPYHATNKHIGRKKLTQEEIRQVFQIDDELLYYEFLTHTGMALMDRAPALASAPSFAFVDFQTVEQEFLSLFRELTEA